MVCSQIYKVIKDISYTNVTYISIYYYTKEMNKLENANHS